jgi:hypothetical protein
MKLAEQKLIMESHGAGVEFATKLAELEMKRKEIEAESQERMQRYQAEMARIEADVHMGHADNFRHILTHQPNHLNQPKEAKNERNSTNR